MEKIVFDKDGKGKRVLPEVHIGNERHSRDHSQIAGKGFVLCDDHGTVPWIYVRKNNTLIKCCRHCVRAYCKLTTAVDIRKFVTEHPDAHSY